MPRIFDVLEVFLAKGIAGWAELAQKQLAQKQLAWRGGQVTTVLSIRNGVFRFRNSPPADRVIRRAKWDSADSRKPLP
jgi:hypothetical protein